MIAIASDKPNDKAVSIVLKTESIAGARPLKWPCTKVAVHFAVKTGVL